LDVLSVKESCPENFVSLGVHDLPQKPYDLVPQLQSKPRPNLYAATVRLGKTAGFLSFVPQIVKEFFATVD